MKMRYWVITSLALFFSMCGIGYTQDAPNAPGKTAANRCSQFKMQVITPVEEDRYKMIVVKPAKGAELKGEVINPCETAPRELGSATPLPNRPRTQEKAAPFLRFSPNTGKAPESQPEAQMKFQLPPLKLNK